MPRTSTKAWVISAAVCAANIRPPDRLAIPANVSSSSTDGEPGRVRLARVRW